MGCRFGCRFGCRYCKTGCGVFSVVDSKQFQSSHLSVGVDSVDDSDDCTHLSILRENAHDALVTLVGDGGSNNISLSMVPFLVR